MRTRAKCSACSGSLFEPHLRASSLSPLQRTGERSFSSQLVFPNRRYSFGQADVVAAASSTDSLFSGQFLGYSAMRSFCTERGGASRIRISNATRFLCSGEPTGERQAYQPIQPSVWNMQTTQSNRIGLSDFG